MSKSKRKFYAQLELDREAYDRLTAEKITALSSCAADVIPNRGGIIVLRFRRESWFYLCGELYALMVMGIKATVTLKEGEL